MTFEFPSFPIDRIKKEMEEYVEKESEVEDSDEYGEAGKSYYMTGF